MTLDRRQIQKPARKLRKLLSKMPSPAATEDVHSFRTNARRLEAMLETFPLDNTKNGWRLSKQISKLRKRAGKVRDFDVLIDYISSFPPDRSESKCSARLLEYLGAQREQDQANRNDRLIAAAEQSIDYSDVRSLADLNRKMLRQIEAFFVNYQRVHGIDFSVIGHGGSRKAYEILHKATDR